MKLNGYFDYLFSIYWFFVVINFILFITLCTIGNIHNSYM